MASRAGLIRREALARFNAEIMELRGDDLLDRIIAFEALPPPDASEQNLRRAMHYSIGAALIKEFGVGKGHQAIHGTLERLTGPVWKTFASPSTRHHLMGNRQTGMLTVIAPGRPIPQAPWISIPPCSVSEHAEIARAFVAQLEDPSRRPILEEILERAGSGPASGFYEKIRDLGLGSAWSPFRRHKLVEILNSKLRVLEIEFKGVMDLDKQNPRPDSTPATNNPPQSATSISHGGIDIQKIAAAAVARMSDSELRNLPIPLGYILDVLVNR